ncbi:MAG: trans-2-enoyl-CoA reductase family protein [Calditrichia bacterium]|nr:trans-2-enoyl-CoA reductase family protein [Calditrichia bacterium]
MIFKPEIVMGLSKTAHPYGCRQEIANQIKYCRNAKQFNGVKKVLIIGASSGFGLATRIAMAFGGPKADTIGVSFETGISGRRTGTAGWYNNIFFKQSAEKDGLTAKNFIGDAFSNEIKKEVIDYIKKEFGKIDLFVYSLAAPRRKDPETGEVYTSTIKTTGDVYIGPTINISNNKLEEKIISRASEAEIKATVKVMGGEDWELWSKLLLENDCLADNAVTLSYSYIGSSKTHQVYKHGSIGVAKRHLEETASRLNILFNEKLGGKAFVSVNKALVTKASAYIPTFPLYAAVLYKVMKGKGIHENCIMQMQRLFSEKVYADKPLKFDEDGLVRMDDWELREDVQQEVERLWEKITPDNFHLFSDAAGYKKDFMQLNGFEIDGVDYNKDIYMDTLKALWY